MALESHGARIAIILFSILLSLISRSEAVLLPVGGNCVNLLECETEPVALICNHLGTCQVPSAEAAACTSTLECAENLLCKTVGTATSKTCAKKTSGLNFVNAQDQLKNTNGQTNDFDHIEYMVRNNNLTLGKVVRYKGQACHPQTSTCAKTSATATACACSAALICDGTDCLVKVWRPPAYLNWKCTASDRCLSINRVTDHCKCLAGTCKTNDANDPNACAIGPPTPYPTITITPRPTPRPTPKPVSSGWSWAHDMVGDDYDGYDDDEEREYMAADDMGFLSRFVVMFTAFITFGFCCFCCVMVNVIMAYVGWVLGKWIVKYGKADKLVVDSVRVVQHEIENEDDLSHLTV